MTYYKLTSCGKTGSTGPTQQEADKFYSDTNVRVKIYGGIQEWTIPKNGLYTLTAAAPSGTYVYSYIPGNGAQVTADFNFKAGAKLYILVGQFGTVPASNWGGAGSGGTFIAIEDASSPYYLKPAKKYVKPLLIAGAGGSTTRNDGCNGNIKAGNGIASVSIMEGSGYQVGLYTCGGAGFASNSKDGTTLSFLNGGIGSTSPSSDGYYSYGGFGGGGCSWNGAGGAGGWHGSNSSEDGCSSNGAYSYATGDNIVLQDAVNNGPGFVWISTKYLSHAKVQSCAPFKNVNLNLIVYVIMYI